MMKPPLAYPFNNLPKIGRRGWFGVIVFLFGVFTVLTAGKFAGYSATRELQNNDSDHYAELMGLAEAAGYTSYNDYLAGQKRNEGIFCSACGTGLVAWGYWTCGRNKRDPQRQ